MTTMIRDYAREGKRQKVEGRIRVNVPASSVMPDRFTADEARALVPYFTNTDRPVFALTNLPETVKGALFARYSRSAKSVRRLFLDEFIGQIGAPACAAANTDATGGAPPGGSAIGSERADRLYARVL